jgi:hypothetical protein
MRGFATSLNPYVSGLRPRRFFQARIELLRIKQNLEKKINKHQKALKAA